MPEPTRIKLMSDYMAGWPVWGGFGLDDPPAEDRLSLELRDALQAWEGLFEDHFGWDTGWDDEAAATQYRDQAVPLVERLRLELAPDVEVDVDLWPLGHRKDQPASGAEWLVAYQGHSLDYCIRAARGAGRRYQVLDPEQTVIDADYQPSRLNLLIDSPAGCRRSGPARPQPRPGRPLQPLPREPAT